MLNIASLNREDMRQALRQRAYLAAKPHPLNPDLVLIENGASKYVYTPEGFAERVEKTIDDVVAAIWGH